MPHLWGKWCLPSSGSRGFVPVIGGFQGQVLGASCIGHYGVCCMDNDSFVKGPRSSVIDAIDVNKDLSFLQYSWFSFCSGFSVLLYYLLTQMAQWSKHLYNIYELSSIHLLIAIFIDRVFSIFSYVQLCMWQWNLGLVIFLILIYIDNDLWNQLYKWSLQFMHEVDQVYPKRHWCG